MPRLTNEQKQAIVLTFYGINPRTLQVDSVSMTRDRKLTRYGIGVPTRTQIIPDGVTPKSEVVTVFELSDIVEVAAHLSNEEFFKRQIEGLEARAKVMRAERDASKSA